MIQFRTEWTAPSETGAQAEVATVIANGREHTALGAVIDEAAGILVGYVKRAGQGFELTSFEGETIALLILTGSWRHGMGGTMQSFRCTFRGQTYTGRGQGAGMLLKLYNRKVRS